MMPPWTVVTVLVTVTLVTSPELIVRVAVSPTRRLAKAAEALLTVYVAFVATG